MIDAAEKAFYDQDVRLLNNISECEYDESSRNVSILDYINKGEESEEIWLEDSVYEMSRKIVHFIFRNGIVEDMHAGKFSVHRYNDIPEGTPIDIISQLSDADMKALNKYMMDRVGYLLHLVQNADYSKLHYLLQAHDEEDADWDMPSIDEIEKETQEIICLDMELHQKNK